MIALSHLLAILIKEVRQLRRDRLTFGMIVGLPILQLMLFGYAINTDVRNLAAAWVDQAASASSRALINELRATQVLDLQGELRSIEDAEHALKVGRFNVIVVIPEDFDRRLARRAEPAAQLLVDGSDPTLLGVASQLRSMPFGFDTQARNADAALFEVRAHYNPEQRSQVNIVPGLLGVILTMTMVLFTAVAIVRERELGNLEFLINTPVSNLELMLGKIIPYTVIGLVQLSLLLALGVGLLHVPIRGSLFDLYAVSLLFIAANLALGLAISTVAKSQFQSMQMTVFILLPSILLSGFMFPFSGMPKLAQWIAEILPMTHYIRLTRGIMLRDAEPAQLSGELLALGVFLLVAMTLSVARFRKRLD